MKILSRVEMKNVMGGFAPGGDDGGSCKTECSKWNSQTLSMQYGTCAKGSTPLGTTCDCSLSGGSSCYAN